MPDDIPSLADLRRRRRPPASTPSLFDRLPQEEPAPEPEVLTVAELVRRARSLVERAYGHVTVEGEISNWRPAASGHCYFTLKDGDAQLSIVLFRRQAQLLRFRAKDGDAVRISGQLSVYESRGQLQLIAESVQQVGLGALLAAVQALKDKLRREGVFANARPLPAFPHCIGVVSSLQGAALRDIVKVCRRRHAAVNLLIYPAAVQGPNCAREVAAGVRWFSAHPNKADVVLIARGGGSWEDLHGFDDEALCRAIAACSLPVLTGIGHATDSVLADAAADLCAPTPSAAAELVTAAQHGIADRLERLHSRLLRSSRYELLRTRQRLLHLSADASSRASATRSSAAPSISTTSPTAPRRPSTATCAPAPHALPSSTPASAVSTRDSPGQRQAPLPFAATAPPRRPKPHPPARSSPSQPRHHAARRPQPAARPRPRLRPGLRPEWNPPPRRHRRPTGHPHHRPARQRPPPRPRHPLISIPPRRPHHPCSHRINIRLR